MENPQWKPKDKDTYALIDRMLLERILLAGIARVLQLSENWLQQYVNDCYGEVPQQAEVVTKTTSRLVVQMAESAQALWESLPRHYRQSAHIYTDHWEAYAGVLPSERYLSWIKIRV